MFSASDTKIRERRYYPMVISENGTGDKKSPLEDRIVWDAFEKLSQGKKDVLLSSEMSYGIKLLQEKFKLRDVSIGHVSLFIRKIFFGEFSLQECEAKVGSMLITTGGGDPNQARAIVEFIQKEILTIQPKPRAEEIEEADKEEQSKRITVNLPLLQALSKFENLGNQLITNDRIRVKSQLEPVRPSLLYWLKYYRDELGIGQHNSVERGDFLFRSENCRKLSPEERERVNLILKSIEENLPLSIDTESQEIIFPTSNAVSITPAGRSVFQGVLVSPHQSESLHTATPAVGYANNGFGSEKNTIPPVETPKRPTFQNPTFFSPVQDDFNDLSKKERIDQRRSETVSHDAGGMSFSAGHIFPAEKEAIVEKSFHPAPTKKAFDDSNPFIIHPSGDGSEEDN